MSNDRYLFLLKISPKVTVWRVEDTRQMTARLGD